MSKNTRMNLPDYTQTLLDMLTLYNTRVSLNNPLSDQENETILNMCIDLYDAAGNYQQIYEDCHKLINTTLSKYNYQPRIPGKPRHSNAMENLPYEIKILIYTMAYKAFELYDRASPNTRKTAVKPSQKGILDYISTPLTSSNSQCYRLSPKTFTQFGISPKIFYDINNYRQITLPSTYPGAKVGYLGYALNYLVAYAGTVDNYVDLFGGSASAFMAVTKTNNVDYYINEYDFFVINYYNVMADDTLYKAYIHELCTAREKLQSHIPAGTAEEGRKFFEVCEKVEKEWRCRYTENRYDHLANGVIRKNKNWQLYASESQDGKVNAAIAYTYIHCFSVMGGSNTSEAVNINSLKKFCNFDVKEYDKFHAHMKRLKEIHNSDMLSNNEFLIEYFTDKAPAKYQTVEKTAKSMRSGSTPDLSDEAKKLLRLLGTDSNGKPRNFRTLFYSDSPYLATKGYKAGGINNLQMKDLIGKLANASQNGSHFIFSCRASKTIESLSYHKCDELIGLHNIKRDKNGNVILNTDVVLKDCSILLDNNNIYEYKRLELRTPETMKMICDLLSQNNDIYQYIFKEFEHYSENYYVLACYEINGFKKTTGGIENANINTMLKVLLPVEVFITDYNFVCPLDFTDAHGKIYRFEKYTISQFCNLLDNNMFKSSKNYTVITSSDDIGSGYSFR